MSRTPAVLIETVFKRAFNAFLGRLGSWLLAWTVVILSVVVSMTVVVSLIAAFCGMSAFTLASMQQITYIGYLAIAALVVAVGWFLSGIALGGIAFVLAYLDRKEMRFGLLFSQFKKAFTGMLAGLVYAFVFFASVVLLILPGVLFSLGGDILGKVFLALGCVMLFILSVYLSVRFVFFYFFIVDKNAGPVESLRKSWNVTRGHVLSIFIIMFLAMLVNSIVRLLVGVSVRSIGPSMLVNGVMFIAMVIVHLFFILTVAVLYRELVPANENKQTLGKNPKPYVR